MFSGKKYKLLSVIVHEGSTEGGHYWAICRRNEKYYIFNDSKVSQTDKICNKNAYILIYEAVWHHSYRWKCQFYFKKNTNRNDFLFQIINFTQSQIN